jgi:hypothetical protein
VQKDDCPQGVGEMTRASAMVSEDSPILEPSDSVLYAGATSAMSAPSMIANDQISAKHGYHELGNPAIPTVSENATVLPAERF